MHDRSHKNVIDAGLIDKLHAYYNSVGVYRSETMKKADPGPALRWIEPLLRSLEPSIDSFIGGNFYKHKHPYNPHTDHQKQWECSTVNFVIPIWFTGSQPHLVVFDQQYNDTTTWTMEKPVAHGIYSTSTNGQLAGAPGTYSIHNNTQKDIDHQLWEEFLPSPQQYYFGLSGKSYSFTPGDIIMFDNKNIHCTSKFNGEKLGLSLRYTIKE